MGYKVMTLVMTVHVVVAIRRSEERSGDVDGGHDMRRAVGEDVWGR